LLWSQSSGLSDSQLEQRLLSTGGVEFFVEVMVDVKASAAELRSLCYGAVVVTEHKERAKKPATVVNNGARLEILLVLQTEGRGKHKVKEKFVSGVQSLSARARNISVPQGMK